MGLVNLLFAIILILGFGFFTINIRKIIRNIKLGQEVNRSDNPSLRWKNMAMIALGQSKMVKKPIAGVLHIIVYVGFIIINITIFFYKKKGFKIIRNIGFISFIIIHIVFTNNIKIIKVIKYSANFSRCNYYI